MRALTKVCLTLATAAMCFDAATANPNESTTPQQVFDDMRDAFRADKARGVQVRYQFELSGAEGGEWWIAVTDVKCKFGRGKIDNPNVTFVASDKDWVALSNGRLNGVWATLTGRLKVRGDQMLARKLDEMFP